MIEMIIKNHTYKIKRYGQETITMEHLCHACSLDGIDCLGLQITDQQYLRLLKDGPMRLNVISSAIGLPSKTIAEVNEPFLIRAGLIMKDDQSRRQLTSKGYEHISKSSLS